MNGEVSELCKGRVCNKAKGRGLQWWLWLEEMTMSKQRIERKRCLLVFLFALDDERFQMKACIDTSVPSMKKGCDSGAFNDEY